MTAVWLAEESNTGDICQRFPLSGEARPLLQHAGKPQDFFELLCQQGLHKDAIRFLAYALPKREAVWWGCLCVWQVCRPSPPREINVAITAALRWVVAPDETRRQAARQASERAKSAPAGLLIRAVVWSGGSMSRNGLPEVAPPQYLTNQTVAAALLAAANGVPPPQRESCYRQFLRWGADVAAGKNRWE